MSGWRPDGVALQMFILLKPEAEGHKEPCERLELAEMERQSRTTMGPSVANDPE